MCEFRFVIAWRSRHQETSHQAWEEEHIHGILE